MFWVFSHAYPVIVLPLQPHCHGTSWLFSFPSEMVGCVVYSLSAQCLATWACQLRLELTLLDDLVAPLSSHTLYTDVYNVNGEHFICIILSIVIIFNKLK